MISRLELLQSVLCVTSVSELHIDLLAWHHLWHMLPCMLGRTPRCCAALLLPAVCALATRPDQAAQAAHTEAADPQQHLLQIVKSASPRSALITTAEPHTSCGHTHVLCSAVLCRARCAGCLAASSCLLWPRQWPSLASLTQLCASAWW
jgi:hypothetical protein